MLQGEEAQPRTHGSIQRQIFKELIYWTYSKLWKNTNLGTVANLEVKAPAMNQIILLPPHQTHKGVKTSVWQKLCSWKRKKYNIFNYSLMMFLKAQTNCFCNFYYHAWRGDQTVRPTAFAISTTMERIRQWINKNPKLLVELIPKP